jgi:serine/threonine protein kinase
MPPEILRLPTTDLITNGTVKAEDVTPIDEKVDQWSFGVTVYELVTGRSPFEGGSKDEIRSNILHNRMRQLPGFLTAECVDWITRAMTFDPASRPSALSLLRHRWVIKNLHTEDAARVFDLKVSTPKMMPSASSSAAAAATAAASDAAAAAAAASAPAAAAAKAAAAAEEKEQSGSENSTESTVSTAAAAPSVAPAAPRPVGKPPVVPNSCVNTGSSSVNIGSSGSAVAASISASSTSTGSHGSALSSASVADSAMSVPGMAHRQPGKAASVKAGEGHLVAMAVPGRAHLAVIPPLERQQGGQQRHPQRHSGGGEGRQQEVEEEEEEQRVHGGCMSGMSELMQQKLKLQPRGDSKDGLSGGSKQKKLLRWIRMSTGLV